METPIYDELVTPYILEEHDWDVACESGHNDPRNKVCDKAASFFMTTVCGVDGFICASEERFVTLLIAEQGRCTCKRDVATCWHIVPIVGGI